MKKDVYDICFVKPTTGFQSYAPFSKILHIHIEIVYVSNSFHSFQVTPLKLATHTPYEELMFMPYFSPLFLVTMR